MADRFERLYELPNNLYAAGSPVVVAAGVLLKDTQTGNVVAQLKFSSVSSKKIIALKVTLNAFDISGNALNTIPEHQYLDLDVYNGDFFGVNKAIVMPDSITRVIKVERITIVFEAGEYQLNGSELLPLDGQEKLTTLLSADLIAQYQIDASTTGEHIPQIVDGLWLCSCKTANATTTCAKCGANKGQIFEALNPTQLREHFRLRQEQQELYVEAEKKKLEEAEAKKAEKKKRIIKFGILVAMVFVASLAVNALKDHISYKRALEEIDSYIDNGKYELAFDLVHTSGISYDDREVYRKKLKPYMQHQHEEWRKSSNKNLAFVVDGIEYYVIEDMIYSKEDGKSKTVLYETPSSDDYLKHHWSIYANGHIFFIEARKTSKFSDTTFTAKCVDLYTGDVKTLGRSDSRGDIVKLESGCLFIGLNLLDFYEGIWYNPYTEGIYVGEDAVSEWEFENAIYMN